MNDLLNFFICFLVMEPIPGGVGARVDLRDVKVIERIGGTVEDTELINGLVIAHRASNVNGPHRIEKAKVGLIQFCISPPKTDVSVTQLFSLLSITHFKYCTIYLHC